MGGASSANGGSIDQSLELALKAVLACLDDLERESQALRGLSGLCPQSGGRLLSEPDDASVFAKVIVAQFGVAVEAELLDDKTVKALEQRVGEDVRARLVGEQLGQPFLAREDVVAVGAMQSLEASSPITSWSAP